MDSICYLILLFCFAVVIIVSFVILKYNHKKIMFMFPLVSLISAAGMFFAFLYGLYGMDNTDGIAVTFFMRLFMLDDNPMIRGNVLTGYITSALLMVLSVAYLIIFWLVYKKKNA